MKAVVVVAAIVALLCLSGAVEAQAAVAPKIDEQVLAGLTKVCNPDVTTKGCKGWITLGGNLCSNDNTWCKALIVQLCQPPADKAFCEKFSKAFCAGQQSQAFKDSCVAAATQAMGS